MKETGNVADRGGKQHARIVTALNPRVQHQCLEASMRTKGNILGDKLSAKWKENRRSK